MTDSTADSTDVAPEVLSTTTAAAPAPTGSPSDPIPSADPTAGVPTAPTPAPVPTTLDAPTPADDVFDGSVPVAETDGGPESQVASGYSPDFSALHAANGEPAVFGRELHELIGHLTGKWIDEAMLTGWFNLLGTQVQQRSLREVVFRIANTPVPTALPGDPALNVLDFRDEIAADLRRTVGLS